MNVPEYQKHLNYTDSLESSIGTLKGLSKASRLHVPYSNLAMFGGRRITLNLEVIYDKIIRREQGGICFEQNGLFGWLLKELGFNVRCCQARRYVEKDDSFTPTYSHLINVVTFDNGEEWIAEVASTVYGPIKKIALVPQIFDDSTMYRLVDVPGQSNSSYLQRHKKTVIDSRGKILKKGPGAWDREKQICTDPKCNEVDSDHWKIVHHYFWETQILEDFSKVCDELQNDPASSIRRSLIGIKFTEPKTMKYMIDGKATFKECLDPLTDKILEVVNLESDIQVTNIMKNHFGIELDHELKFYSACN